MVNQPLVSIVIPVYNGADFLRECIDSALAQTYENIEIIVINDGSSDNSLEILKEYERKDNRVVIIDKQNEGAAKSRNVGIDAANGEFMMFLDSDDWIEPTACEEALAAIEKYNTDICFFTYIREFLDKSKTKFIYADDEKYFTKEECKNILCKRIIGLSGEELKRPENGDAISPFWGKLYRSSLIKDHDIEIVDLSLVCTCEDGLFNISAFYYANGAVYINRPLYHYRKYNSSSITTGYKENLFNGWQNLFEFMQEFIENNNCDDSFKSALYNRIAVSIIGLGLNILSSDKSYKDKITDIASVLRHEDYVKAYKQFSLRYLPIHWKLFFLCAKFKFAFGLYFLLYIMKRMIGK